MTKYIDEPDLIKRRNEMFFRDHDMKMNEITNTLMDFRLNTKVEDKKKIKCFFCDIKVKASDLGYEELSKVGEYYENYIDSITHVDTNSHKIFSDILKGTGDVKRQIDELRTKHRQRMFTKDIKINKTKTRIKKGNILLLDDDRLISAVLRDAFEAEGYNIMTTKDPYEAIEHILYKDIHIALIDIVMPQLNGFEVLDILKRNDVDIPIIFLSGRAMTDYKVRALSRGVDDYITKPFEIKEVIARVERSLGRTSIYKDKLTTDKLTGVYNKEYFNEKIAGILSNKEYIDKSFSLSFIDLDDFKYINDNCGHVIGDYALRDFADFLKRNLDETEMIFRFGGDEFIVIFVGKKVSEAYLEIENLRKKLDETSFEYEGLAKPIKLNMSSGITYVGENESVEEILDRADKCLYQSKELGRNKTMKSKEV